MTETEQIDEILTMMDNGECISTSKDDSQLVINLMDKLIAYELITPRGNTFDLTRNGYEAIKLGGFRQFLDFQEKQQQPIPAQSMTFNAPVISSQFGLSSNFGNLESSHNSINLKPIIAKQQPIETSNKKINFSIWDKIYKWTDHKLISMIIYGLLCLFGTAVVGWLVGWLGLQILK